MLPDGVNGADIIYMLSKGTTYLGSWPIKVAGKLFRIGHLGDMNEVHLCAGISGAEMSMRIMG